MKKQKENGVSRTAKGCNQGATANCHGKVSTANCLSARCTLNSRRRKRHIATCFLAATMLVFLAAAVAACAGNRQPKQITLSFDAVLLQYTEAEAKEAPSGTLAEEKIAPVSVFAGKISQQDLPRPAPREGYRFLYWSASPDGAAALQMEENGTLFAVWQPQDFTFVATEAEFLAMEPGGKYLLTADFTVFAQYGGTFSGVLDGAWHTVTLGGEQSALFLRNAGTVRRLKISGTAVGESLAAGLVIYNLGRVENCSVSGSVTSQGASGGVVAVNSGYLAYVRFSGDVCGKSVAGGVVGSSIAAKIAVCRADGSVRLTAERKGVLGGVAGEIAFDHRDVYYTLSSAEDCAFYGTLQTYSGDRDTKVGGVAGSLSASVLSFGFADFTASVGERVLVYGVAQTSGTVSVYGTVYTAQTNGCGFSQKSKVFRAGAEFRPLWPEEKAAEESPVFSSEIRAAFLSAGR